MYMKVIWMSELMTFLEFVGEHPVFSFLSLLIVFVTVESIVCILKGKDND